MNLLLIVFFISLLILGSGMVVKWLQNKSLTEPLLAMVIAIVLSPAVLGVLHTGTEEQTHEVLLIACKFTIAMALMSTALRVPPAFLKKNFSSQTILVMGGMILMWLSTGSVLYLVLDRPFTECLLLGALVSPTDPVVAATIITGQTAEKYLPASIRNTLSFESGANDGLALPIVAFSLLLYKQEDFHWEEWVFNYILYETIAAAGLAILVGYLAGKALHRAHQSGLMTRTSFISFSVALAFLIITGEELIGMNGILGVFAGGVAFASQIAHNEDLAQEPIQESMERIFTIPVFFLFGLILPWEEWAALGWTAVWICLGVLLFRRVPAFILMTPLVKQFRGNLAAMLLMGWFGPIGVAALFYALYAREQTGLSETWVITSLLVFVSTLIHGLTSVPLEKWYGRNHRNLQDI